MEIKKYQLEPEVRQFNGIAEQDKIFLSIQIGNGQIGGSKVMLDAQQLAKGNLTQHTFIGDSNNLINKEIEIETNVLDVNQFTNKCVITTTFLNQDNKILFTKIDIGEAPENGIASFNGKYRLMLLLFLLFIFSFNTNKVSAQSVSDKITFQNLETPSSPGFVLLDKTPSSIEKPTTPQGFGVSVLGLLQGKGGAMEFAPFWLVNHPKLSAEKMYKNKMPVLYNFSISAATVKTDTVSYIAGGIRTRLFQSYNKGIINRLDSIKTKIEDALADLDTTKIKVLQKMYAGLLENPIFTIDVAGAIGGGSNTNSFHDAKINRWAAWLSFNWRPKGDNFYITALTRYMNNEKFEDYTAKADLLDIGTRLNYDILNICVSLEYLQRFNLSKNNDSDNRIAIIGSYKLSDNIYFTTTFGKNFSETNNIIALAGINFGISKSKIKAF
ncbi:hypothetical protein IM793_18110 [Pedobacter sp. MR2016-19]|uniref:hypothetical protein n=1 Tax=Pedobacter sp. MR2016-19 TaxID=2780089 RepID=UPI001873E42D|nr:hypothetical protein [Pedobacter sp. MR2016-19]MBE5321086.1 hypothetical protein [Pedobacter sp. MR2016-19]